MSADTLTATSRAFYERSKAKLALSIITGAAGMVLLGFCSSVGGQASSANESKGSGTDDTAIQSLVGGYGFASFCFIIAFILMTAAAIYISPFATGSSNEVKMIRAPQEIDAGYSAYSESSSAPPAV